MYLPRKHRTALFVRVNEKNSSSYKERVRRLVNDSLNGSNIKVDVYTALPNGDVVKGLQFAETPTVSPGVRAQVEAAGYKLVKTHTPSTGRNHVGSPRLREAAADAGYTLVLIADAADEAGVGESY